MYHYMRLRSYQFILETQTVLELLYYHLLLSLPQSIHKGHEGRLLFLKRALKGSVRALTEQLGFATYRRR